MSAEHEVVFLDDSYGNYVIRARSLKADCKHCGAKTEWIYAWAKTDRPSSHPSSHGYFCTTLCYERHQRHAHQAPA